MVGVTVISVIVLLTCITILLYENSRRGREWIRSNHGESKSFVVVNVILWISFVLALMISMGDSTGMLFTDASLAYNMAGIVLTIGWGIVFTQIVQGKESSRSKPLHGLSHLIALRAMKSETPEATLLDSIQSEKESDRLNEQDIRELIRLIGNRADSIGAYARRIAESTEL